MALSGFLPKKENPLADLDARRPRRRRIKMTARRWEAIGADWTEDEILDEFRVRPDIAWRVCVQDDMRLVGYIFKSKIKDQLLG